MRLCSRCSCTLGFWFPSGMIHVCCSHVSHVVPVASLPENEGKLHYDALCRICLLSLQSWYTLDAEILCHETPWHVARNSSTCQTETAAFLLTWLHILPESSLSVTCVTVIHASASYGPDGTQAFDVFSSPSHQAASKRSLSFFRVWRKAFAAPQRCSWGLVFTQGYGLWWFMHWQHLTTLVILRYIQHTYHLTTHAEWYAQADPSCSPPSPPFRIPNCSEPLTKSHWIKWRPTWNLMTHTFTLMSNFTCRTELIWQA